MSSQYNSLQHKNQVLISKKDASQAPKPKYLADTNPIPFNLRDPMPNKTTALGIINAITPEGLRVLNTYLSRARKYKINYGNQKRMAIQANVSRKTFNEWGGKFHNWRFLEKKTNGANKTCWVKVSRWFNDPEVQKALKNKLAIFFYMSGTLLLSGVFTSVTRGKNVFKTFIYKELLLPNVNTSTYVEKDNQKRILKKKGNEIEIAKKKELIKSHERCIDFLKQKFWEDMTQVMLLKGVENYNRMIEALRADIRQLERDW